MDVDEETTGWDATKVIPEEALQAVRRPIEERHASLIVLAGDEIGAEHDLPAGPLVIGRADTAGLRVRSNSVSRHHAQIERIKEGDIECFRIRDLASINGTRVNNTLVTDVILHNGDKIQIGEVTFKFAVQDAEDVQFSREIHRLIHYDQLTGLMLMKSFRRVLEETIHSMKRGQVFTLAMTDLDGLKRVNDTYGHLAGRMVVGEMGAMMRATIRPSDFAGLYGGDEAIMLYPGTSLEEAQAVAEQLRKTIEARVFEHEGKTLGVTISQGLSEWPRHGKSPEDIIAAADRALYAAKDAGRNCVRTAAG